MLEIEKLKMKLKEALEIVGYLEFTSEEERFELRKMSYKLSNRIKSRLGECHLWYLSNRIIRDIDDAQIVPKGG